MSRKGKKRGKGKKHKAPSGDASAPRDESSETPAGAAQGDTGTSSEKSSEKSSEEKKLNPLEEQIEELTDRLQRKTAEFANYQKRIQKEMDDTRKYAIKPLALDLLQVVDSFERALDSSMGDSPEQARVEDEFVKGFQMIYDLLKGALTSHGIAMIEAKDELFDPNRHDAVMEEENPDLPDKTVIDELVKGYMLHERLLRPARVRVSRVPKEQPEELPEDQIPPSDEEGSIEPDLKGSDDEV